MIYSVVIQKGGSGKTTTAAALAQAATNKGCKVLAIDLDPQGNLTYALAGQAMRAGAYKLLHGAPAADVIQHTPQGLDLISASPELQTEASTKGSALRLQTALTPLQGNYDYVFIDTPSTAGEMQYNAIQAAQGLIIPLQADAYNLQSVYQTIATTNKIMRSNKDLTITGIVFTMFDARPKINRTMRQVITDKCQEAGIPCLGTIRKGIAAQEAAALQKSLYDYAPRSNPAQDYMKILEQLPN